MPATKVNSLQMASRRALLEAQPTTKWINVVETTHGVPIQKRILVRNNIRDVDQLMMTMTNRLQPEKGAIRNLYTPSGGTQVTSLDQLNPDGSYVAGAGTQKFKQISNVIRQTSREKNHSVSSDENSSKNDLKGKRISLIQRQNMIAQKAKDAKSTGSSNISSNTNSQTNLRPNNNLTLPKNGSPKRKYKVNVTNRRPLYPGNVNKKATPPSSPPSPVRKNPRRRVAPRVGRKKPPLVSNKSSVKSTAKGSRRGSTRSFTVLGSAHSNRSANSGRSKKSKGSRSRSPSRTSNRSRTPSPGTATPSRSPSAVSARSDRKSPSRRGSMESDRKSLRSRHSSRRSSRHSSRADSNARSPSNDRSPSRKSERSEANSNKHSRSPSRGPSRGESGGRSRSVSPIKSRSASRDRSRIPSPERSPTPSRDGSRSPSRDRSRTQSRERSRTPSPGRSRTPSARAARSNSLKESTRSGRSQNTRRSSRRNSILTIQSKRSRRSNSESRHNSGGSRRSRSRNSHTSRHSDSGGTKRSSRRSSIRSRRSTTHSERSNRSTSRKRTEDVMDDSDVEDTDKVPSHHGSLRYGSNFSNRSIRLNTTGQGYGKLNDAAPSPLVSGTSSSRFTDYDGPFKASRSSSGHRGSSRRAIEVDYDTDESGLYRAKGENEYAKNAPIVMDSTNTKINTPLEMMEAKEIDDEEFYSTRKTFKNLQL